MLIELRPLDSITPYDKNPRRNDGAVEAVAQSLREYKVRQPIVVDRDGVIVVGHTRWKAAKMLGMTEFPVHVAHDLTPEQARAYRIADNQTATIAEWDMELLPLELAELKDLGVDLSLLGFDDDTLKELLAPKGTEGLADADDTPEPPKVAVTQPGDVWLLGEHRLLCGDSTKPEHADRVMNGHKAALCATDPPYLIEYTGSRMLDGKERGKDWSETYREIEITDAEPFYRCVFGNVKRVIAPKAAVYCWHAHPRYITLAKVWAELEILNHQMIIWVKPSPLFGHTFYMFRHEPCLMGWVKGSMPEHDADHTYNSVWEIDWEGKKKFTGEHPTTKPVEIFARPIRKHTKRGQVCFEPFSGSGSQIIAAEQLGRRCYAIELEPVFVDVALNRWSKFTGKEPVLESTGETFEQVRAKRGIDTNADSPTDEHTEGE
jgi:DNA modification methylase